VGAGTGALKQTCLAAAGCGDTCSVNGNPLALPFTGNARGFVLQPL